jgi:hypothetical protein
VFGGTEASGTFNGDIDELFLVADPVGGHNSRNPMTGNQRRAAAYTGREFSNPTRPGVANSDYEVTELHYIVFRHCS